MPGRIAGPGSKAETFLLLCRCLADDGGAADLRGDLVDGVDWLDLVEVANRHLVTPSLWSRLLSKAVVTDLPEDVQRYLSMIHAANRRRNRLIRLQATDAAAVLKAEGIAPVLLKGAAFLFDGSDAADRRIVSDIDFLVPEQMFASALAALCEKGYVILDDTPPSEPFHALTLYREGEIATLDVHRHVGQQRSILAPDDAVAGVRPVDGGGVELAVLSPAHRLVYNVLNAMVLNPNYRLGVIPLRHLLDVVDLGAQQDMTSDWTEARAMMAAHRLEGVFDIWLSFAHRLLGLSLPIGLPVSPRLDIQHWRLVLQLDHPWLGFGAGLWAALSHPFNRFRMDYLYGQNGATTRIYRRRFFHAARLLRRHRLRAVTTFAPQRAMY